MRVLVDTSVWSLALRRGSDSTAGPVRELRSLIGDNRVQMIGAIRQELLSGIRDEAQFKELEARLSAFPDLPVSTDEHVMAARFYNECRGKGVQGSNTDFLICAVAVHHRLAIFTTDNDFALYAKHLPIALHR
ncbi:MAG: PIN domain-containing protein [Candidatus Eisenbacteria bacterium]